MGLFDKGAEDAAQAQQAAAEQALALQREQYEKQLELTQPWQQAGERALSLYESMLMGTPYDPTAGTAKLSDEQIAALEAATTYSPEGTFAQLVDEQMRQQLIAQATAQLSSSPMALMQYGDRIPAMAQQMADSQMAAFASLPFEERQQQYQQLGLAPNEGSIRGMQDLLDQQEALRAQQAQQQQAGGYAPSGGMTPKGGIDYSAFYQSPDYQFRMQQGQRALERSAAAKGGLLSGQQMVEQQKYGQGLASQAYSDYMNRLGQLAGVGTVTPQTSANIAGQFGQQAGQTMQDIGAARASGYAAEGQAQSNLIGTGLGLAGMFFSDKNLKENIKKVGEENGHNIYEFNYIGHDKKYTGVMAQEVQKTRPDCVAKMSDGYLAVDYGRLGIEMKEVA